MKICAIAMLAFMTACATLSGQYTGDEYYYTKDGENWSCREPKPYLGGYCRPEKDWGVAP